MEELGETSEKMFARRADLNKLLNARRNHEKWLRLLFVIEKPKNEYGQREQGKVDTK